MNILMLGNGFDLEHGLPTRYVDFLNFVNDFNNTYIGINENILNLCDIKNDYLQTLFQYNISKDRINALHIFTYENIWIKYFQNCYEDHLKHKENWIDFEEEISKVVQTIDNLIKYYEKNQIVKENAIPEDICIAMLLKVIDKDLLKKENIKSIVNRLVDDLNKLICALEIYIWDYVDSIKIQYYNPDILITHFDKVISFNYSNTFGRLYNIYQGVEFDFVHGKARNNISSFSKEHDTDKIRKCEENNNMVLGIDEYLPESKVSKEIEFIQFKKYYQRIYKHTGNKYKKWLREIDVAKDSKNILYIFGHSLDITDGDVLRDFINHENLKTIIFYKNKKQLEQQIINLVKVLGSNVVIEKVHGNNPSIEFRLQCQREVIKSSAFDIYNDIIQLRMICKVNSQWANYLLDKIDKKITERDLQYFHSQKEIICLFDLLQRNGLEEEYKEKLLDIAYQLKSINKSSKLEIWDYPSGCGKETKNLVDLINKHNHQNYVQEDIRLTKYDDILERIQDIANIEEIDENKYIDIVKTLVFIFRDSEIRYNQNLWNVLAKISIGPAKKVARSVVEELLRKSTYMNDLHMYKRLLVIIQQNESKKC